jgi:hypothetical protein
MTSDDPFLFCPLGCLALSLWPLMIPFCTKEKGVIRGHKEKDRQPNGAKRKGSSEAIWRTESFSLWPLMRPFSFVHWVVCLSLYGLWWSLSLWSKTRTDNPIYKREGSSEVIMRRTDNPMDKRERGHQRSYFLFCLFGLSSFFSLWPLMSPFSFVH